MTWLLPPLAVSQDPCYWPTDWDGTDLGMALLLIMNKQVSTYTVLKLCLGGAAGFSLWTVHTLGSLSGLTLFEAEADGVEWRECRPKCRRWRHSEDINKKLAFIQYCTKHYKQKAWRELTKPKLGKLNTKHCKKEEIWNMALETWKPGNTGQEQQTNWQLGWL